MKYIVDSMLGRLATWLRILGYDSEFFHEAEDKGLLLRALKENRTIITRNSHLRKRLGLKIIFIKSDFIREQVRQLLTEQADEFVLVKERLFSRCTLCNREVESVPKENVRGRVPPYVYDTYATFSQCTRCHKIYWQGTHWEKLLQELKTMRGGK